MSEKELIKYLLEKKVFVKFEDYFLAKIKNEIFTLKRISNSQFEFVATNANVDILTDIFNEDEIKLIINSLLVNYFNNKSQQNTNVKPLLLDENDIPNLNYQYIKNKFPSHSIIVENIIKDLSKITPDDFFKNSLLIRDLDKYINETQVMEIKVEYLYNYFFQSKDNWNLTLKNTAQNIQQDISLNNLIKIDNFIFEGHSEYHKVLDAFNEIKFLNTVEFNDLDTDALVKEKNAALKFEKCKIQGKFKHIFVHQ